VAFDSLYHSTLIYLQHVAFDSLYHSILIFITRSV